MEVIYTRYGIPIADTQWFRGVHRVEFRVSRILRIGLFEFESFLGKFETRFEFEMEHVKPTRIRIVEFESNSSRIRVYPNSVEKNILLQNQGIKTNNLIQKRDEHPH